MDNRRRITAGVSSGCGYPDCPETVVRDLCERGVKVLELFLNTHSEVEPEYIRELSHIIAANGSECVSMHPFTCGIDTYMLYSGYERRARDYIEYHKRYFEAMNILGAKYFVLHGNKNPYPDDVVFEGYLRLDAAAKEFGVKVLQENVCRCTTGELSQLVRMKKALGDEASFVLDTKQAVRKGLDPYDFIPALNKSVKHVHFSDYGEKGDCLLPGQGIIDTRRFIYTLMANDFEGAIILELYRNNYDGYDSLINSLNYIQRVIDNGA